jgi:K+-transporting ATPase ATPase C chain
MNVADLNRLIAQHIAGRAFGFLGEPHVNVLELNLALDGLKPE